MKRWIWSPLVLLAIVASGCNTPPDPAEADLVPVEIPCIAASGSVADAAGDAASQETVPPPDLVSGTIVVANCRMTLDIQLAAGTLNASKTRIVVLMDIDQNPNTGSANYYTPGIEYLVDFDPKFNKCNVSRYTQGHWEYLGNVAATVNSDAVHAEIPLSNTLLKDDGRMNLWIQSTSLLTGTNNSEICDCMPNQGQPAAVVQ